MKKFIKELFLNFRKDLMYKFLIFIFFLFIFVLFSRIDTLTNENQLLKTTISHQSDSIKLKDQKIDIFEDEKILYLELLRDCHKKDSIIYQSLTNMKFNMP